MNSLFNQMTCLIAKCLAILAGLTLWSNLASAAIGDTAGIQMILIKVIDPEERPVPGAKVFVKTSKLDEILGDPNDPLHRYAQAAKNPRPTDGLGATVAYFWARTSIHIAGKQTTHTVALNGTLVVEVEGFEPFSKELVEAFGAKAVDHGPNRGLLFRVELKRTK
jgi:hypothetical protein